MFIIYGNLNFIPGKSDGHPTKTSKPTSSTMSAQRRWPTTSACRRRSPSTQMLAFEAYNVRADPYETHFRSQPMEVFLKKIAPTMTTGLDLKHYEDVAGYLDKADMKECGIFYDTRIKAADGKRDEVLARLGKLAKWVEENEKEAFTYLVLKGLDNEDGVRVFERYASRKALEAHQSGREYIELLMCSKELIKSMAARGYGPNGWLHR